MKLFLFIATILISTPSMMGQVGIGTENIKGIFHIDSKQNNPATGAVSLPLQQDDFLIDASGNTGVGTLTPANKLEINSGTQNISGLKFSQVNSSTPIVNDVAAGLGVNASGDVVTSAALSRIGDIKYSIRTSDHVGWYLLDGRAVSSLPANSQISANSLGFSASLPNASDRILKMTNNSEANTSTGGSSLIWITQANMPNFNFAGTVNGATTNAGNHNHTSASGGFLLSGSTLTNNGTGYYSGNASTAVFGGIGQDWGTGGAGSHTHSISVSSVTSTGGQGISLNNVQPYMAINIFIYLGQ